VTNKIALGELQERPWNQNNHGSLAAKFSSAVYLVFFFFSKEKKDNFVFLLKQKNKGCLSKNSQKQNITRGAFW
jgi:hypothetical protein